MSETLLEERVTRLEKRLDVLTRAKTGGSPERKSWRDTVGMFKRDPIMKEIIEEALRIREQERALVQQEREEK